MLKLRQQLTFFLLALALAGLLVVGLSTAPDQTRDPLWPIFALLIGAAALLAGWVAAQRATWRAVARRRRRWPAVLGGVAITVSLVAVLVLALWLLVWLWRPEWLPQRAYYDLLENRHVTERLVDPALLKVERWDILGETHEVLFVHPAASGSVALVYPVKIEPGTTLVTDLAVAPEAWTLEGDGLTVSVYVEDRAGIHLVYGRYVDPKHQQQDRGWLPLRVPLGRFRNKLVRLILVTDSGPAGDRRYDWAGWGEPRLERPVWP